VVDRLTDSGYQRGDSASDHPKNNASNFGKPKDNKPISNTVFRGAAGLSRERTSSFTHRHVCDAHTLILGSHPSIPIPFNLLLSSHPSTSSNTTVWFTIVVNVLLFIFLINTFFHCCLCYILISNIYNCLSTHPQQNLTNPSLPIKATTKYIHSISSCFIITILLVSTEAF
jgi:hypothetical protein